MKVSIITRTKNRNVLLKRAIQSVTEQTFTDYQHVIINDGGDRDTLEAFVEKLSFRKGQTTFIHNPSSLGMEAATNKALASCAGELLVVHDDDDSWEPTFLSEMVSFLDQNSLYGGVVSFSMEILERINGNLVEIAGARPYNPHVRSITLYEISKTNLFPPIAFVYRRSILENAGSYDESLPVLGDWEFNLRFLSCASIGMLPKRLANYHVRISTSDANTGNSITAGFNRHLEYRRLINDRLLRKDLTEGRFGLGIMTNLAYDNFRSFRNVSSFVRLKDHIKNLSITKWFITRRYKKWAADLQRRFHGTGG